MPRPAPTPPRLGPDRTIRALRDGDVSTMSEELEFDRKPDQAQLQQLITDACKMLQARLQRANDPSVYEPLAKREVHCWAVGNSLSHIVEVPRPSDGSPRHWRIYAIDAASKAKSAPHHVRLGQSLFALWPRAKKIVSDPKAPKKPRWWECLKDMRKRTGDE
jgi:hypothetical protein